MRFIAADDLNSCSNWATPNMSTSASKTWLAEIWQTWHDKRFVRSECKKALSCFRGVRSDQPGMAKRDLYREVVTRCLGSGPDRAIRIVRRAEQSYAAWPAGRDVRFRDVVTYVLVEECLISKRRTNDHAHIEAIVAAAIPGDL